MKREDLKKLELPDETIDAIMGMYGASVAKFKDGEGTLKAELDALKSQLAEAGATIEGFKALKPDELKAAADEWKAKAEQAAKEAAQMVDSLKFDYALRDALKVHKVKDPADVLPHLRRDALKLADDGKIIGLDEQLGALKTAKEYLFDSETQPLPKITTSTQSSGTQGADLSKFFGLKQAQSGDKQ